MRRRRLAAIEARRRWLHGPAAPLARLLAGQTAGAAITPRADRIVSLTGLAPGARYLDVGCGTAAYAHLLAARARLDALPVCLDLADAPGSPLDAVAWPEQLPFADESFDVITSLYFVHRFDDDVVHAFAGEVRRLLAPGGAALVLDFAPMAAGWLNAAHSRMLAPGAGSVDLRGWGRMAALFTELGFDAIDLVNTGPYLLPPVPRIGILCRRAPAGR